MNRNFNLVIWKKRNFILVFYVKLVQLEMGKNNKRRRRGKLQRHRGNKMTMIESFVAQYP